MRSAILAVSLLAAAAGGFAFVHDTVDVDDAPRRLDAADLDGDGDVDLFVMADADGQANLQVLLNDGGEFSAGWSAVQDCGSAAKPWDVDLSDTNGDGQADVLYVLPSGSPFQRFNDGAGNFSASSFVPAFAGRAEQEPIDVDGDGDADLVYYEEDIVGYFGTLKGDGEGGFQFDLSTETWFGLVGSDFARRFVLGDVTGDGLQDAAMASTHGLQFFKGKPAETETTLPGWFDQVKLYATPCLDVATVDLNGDSQLDVVASVPSLHSVVVFLSVPTGFGGPRLFAAGTTPDAIAAADLDLDGTSDVIVADRALGTVNVLRGLGNGSLGPPKSFPAGRHPTDVAAADFDGDGDDDLAVACAVAGNVAILINTSQETPFAQGFGFAERP